MLFTEIETLIVVQSHTQINLRPITVAFWIEEVRNVIQSDNFDVRLSNGKFVHVLMEYTNLTWLGCTNGGYSFDNEGFILWAEQNQGFTDNQGNFYSPSEIIVAQVSKRSPNHL